jgi:GNAT superfamily N-acetyltransferase
VSAAGALDEYPKTIVLSDGTHLVLRPMAGGDGPALEALLGRLPEEERARLPETLAALARPGGAAPSGADSSPGLAVVALDGEDLAAVAVLERGASPSRGHVAEIALAIDPGRRGRRLGTWMLLDCVHVAAGLGIEQVVASVTTDEHAYLAALRRLDFAEAAPPPARRRGLDGSTRATVVMVKTLHRGWPDF